MNKNLMAIMITIVFLTLIGCPNDSATSTDGTSGSAADTSKITSLQVAIDQAAPGAVIDAAQYTGITQYDANINKAVTIQNFSDLKGASLNVSADGVVLSNLGKTSVTTNSSLKISGSSLSSLNIGAVDTGRGEPVIKS